MAFVVEVSIFNTSLSSRTIGPLATLHIVGPVIEAYAICIVDVFELSVILVLNILEPLR